MRGLSICLIVALSWPVSGAELPPIEDLMSESEMAVTGINKLTPEQKQALREWLEVFVDQDAKFAAKEYAEQRKEEEIRARKSQKQPGIKIGRIFRRDAENNEQAQENQNSPNRFNKNQAKIVGDFSGWSGRTTFILDNGEVWQQRRADSVRRTKRITNPEVKIKKNLMGFYVMEIPAVKVKMPVTRIK